MPLPPQAQLDWRDAIPVSRRFDDPYFSLAGGLAETDHVFLQGNRLPDRLTDGFRIAELGFGTGLNLMATLALWSRLNRPGTLHYTSFEAFRWPPKTSPAPTPPSPPSPRSPRRCPPLDRPVHRSRGRGIHVG